MGEKKVAVERYRYGIGEWYGYSFAVMSGEKRRTLASRQLTPKKNRPPMPCLPRGGNIACSKDSGVCSIRVYQQTQSSGSVVVASGERGRLVTTCPYRFEQGDIATTFVSEEILHTANPLTVDEIGFLERAPAEHDLPSGKPGREDVGRIDRVLVHPTGEPMSWCALEMQAVYFSGEAMSKEYAAIINAPDDELPFPVLLRRPDWRSSGPKRLMPQLQIKVPTLRRWGKKMAVVVDESFFAALGAMDSVPDISNADIAWFVLRYDESAGDAVLSRGEVVKTTLERAVEGLTAGRPVSLSVFENRIRAKLHDKH